MVPILNILKSFTKEISKAVFIGFIVSLLIVPMSLFVSQTRNKLNVIFDDNYTKFLSLEDTLVAQIREKDSQERKNRILSTIKEIEKLEKINVYGSAYSLSVIYAYGIPKVLQPSRVLCNKFKVSSAARLNPSAILIDC